MLGIMGRKVCMTQIFNEEGSLVPVTVLKIEPNVVIGTRIEDKDGYKALILGAFDIKKKRVKKPVMGQYAENIEPKRIIKEFRGYEQTYNIGDKIGVEIFEGMEYLDVQSMSKGKGFQGVIKRHGFSGGRKTHGSKFHRAAGSTGMNTCPGRVMPGRKMAGHMGNEIVTVQNLKIVKVDKENNLMLVKGGVPGPNNNMILLLKSKKKAQKIRGKQ